MVRLSPSLSLLLLAACSGAGAPAAPPRDAGTPAPDGFVLPKPPDAGSGEPAAARGACDSSFRAVARMIFEQGGCTAATCHTTPGPDTPAAGLDLTEEDALAGLIRVPARAALVQPLVRVTPGDPQASFLWLKLAAAEPGGPGLPEGGGGPMPLGRAPLPAASLAALGAWIRAGAQATGVAPGTEALLEACQAAER
jgi:hypothetical protein